jgi:2-polyprenyl-3-methyl-5-hydroxy-6-metoxy-1,4-benzoquinol methylase
VKTARLTTKSHWQEAWADQPRARLPSPLVVGTRNMQRILRPAIRPGMRVLELGCAPGKILAWAAAALHAKVAGLDYSERGVDWSRRLFDALGLVGDIRCEDALQTTFPARSFDVVYSFGLIEHFADPRPIVRVHVNLAKPGGRVIVGIPNYGGIYGRLQRWFDPENLSLHNLDIMGVTAMARLAPDDLSRTVRSYHAGRLSPWQISFERRLPRNAARAAHYLLNGVGLVQPFDIAPLCPFLVLEITRAADPAC